MTTAEQRQPTLAVRDRSGPSTPSREPSADSRPPPPPYASIAQPIENRQARSRTADALFNHEWAHLGLPTGFFLLRNAAQGKTLDLLSHRQDEGAELGLHPIKQPLLQGVSLQHKGNNQLFCLSWDGHLIAGASSRAVDVEDWRLVQAFPHPIMSLHSRLSHPPARFRLDPTTSTLHVLFDTDPHYSGPNGSDEWRSHDYIVEAVPRKRKPAGSSAWSAASEQAGQVLSGIGSTAATLGEKLSAFGLFSSGRGSASSSQQTSPKLGSGTFTSAPTPTVPSKASTTSVSASSGLSTAQSVAGPSTQVDPASAAHATDTPTSRVIDVEPDPEEAESGSDSDSEPAAYRPLRVVRLEPGWREKFPAEALQAAPDTSFGVTRWSSSPKELRKWRRRMWDVIPVTIRRMPAPAFPVHNAERAGGTVPMSASESRSASASDSHEDGSSPDDDERYTEEEDESVTQQQQQHLAPPTEVYAMADYFGIGSHETSGASSPVNSRSRRPSAYAAGVTTALSSTVTAASHLTGLLSSRLLPLSLAPASDDTGDGLADEEEGTDGETTGLQATPRLPEEEWDANVVGSRELDALARERQSSTSAESSAGEWETDAETPRLESGPPPVRKVQREQHRHPPPPPPPAASTTQQ